MKSKKTLAVLVLPVALIAAACGEDVLTGPSAVGGGPWPLRNIQLPNFSIVEISRPASYTVEFREGGLLSVRADCNMCSGSYQASGAALTVGPLACTRAYCGEASHDTTLLRVLGGASSHGVQDGVLTIDSSQGVLRFMR